MELSLYWTYGTVFLHKMILLTVFVQLFEQIFIINVRTFINVPYFMMETNEGPGKTVR